MGRTPAEVYPEWAQRRRGHETLKQLDDPLIASKCNSAPEEIRRNEEFDIFADDTARIG